MKMKVLNVFFAGILFSAACNFANSQSIEDVVLNVYKEPTCGCCNGWIEHMNDNGYSTAFHHPTNIQKLKDKFGLKNEWRSCHTAVHEDGFYFEGHIPEKFIARFLSAPPEGAMGLAVPGMPIGGPGMEMGNRFTPYDILLINKDGSHSIFASIKKASEQH